MVFLVSSKFILIYTISVNCQFDTLLHLKNKSYQKEVSLIFMLIVLFSSINPWKDESPSQAQI